VSKLGLLDAHSSKLSACFHLRFSGKKQETGTWQHPTLESVSAMTFSLRKEVIQPQVLLRLPCYDFTPIMNHTLDGCPLAVGTPASSAVHFRDVTGGVYKARERIHRSVLICDY
jgi:hypothetical protein